jgi:2-methylcitrate dehydratase PrpD
MSLPVLSAHAATQQLATFVTETRFENLPTALIQRAKWITADTIGVALRGSIEPEMHQLYLRLLAGASGLEPGRSTLLTTGLPAASPAAAALANATAACFLELDEGSRPTGHPALHVLPPALAYAEATHKSGKEYLTALILGYEVQARLQWASRLRYPVHPHGNFGHLGATAALGRLAGWSPSQMCQGLTAAAALVMATSWQPCLAGATVRNAYPGLTAQTAFTVKLLVESGFTGYHGALEETFGEVLGERFDPEALIQGLGSRFGMLENYFKFHAACALIHPVLDAVAAALGGGAMPNRYPPVQPIMRPDPTTIERIEVRVAERSMRLAVQAQPNQLSAKFSIPFAVASFLIAGAAGPEAFQGEALTDPQVAALAQKVDLVGLPEFTARWPVEAVAEAVLHLKDGKELRGLCSNPYGSSLYPPRESDLELKFRTLTAGLLPPEEQHGLWATAMKIETLPQMPLFLRKEL